MSEPERYTFGIEEEFFLVGARTRTLPSRLPKRFVEACRRRLGDCIGHEMLQTQVEISSPVFSAVDEALACLRGLRQGLAQLAVESRLSLVSAGTHPMSAWYRQRATVTSRYTGLVDDFQIVGRRNLVCGLHVHVAVPGGIDRVQLMNRIMPWLPLFLALSTSSPFWNRRRTGLLSYRQAAYDEWPRTGIPDAFDNEADYAGFVQRLVDAGAMKDAGMLWWAIRPALRFPTLELRIADACTHVEDSVAIASLFRCLVRAHVRDTSLGTGSSTHTRRLIDENRWRAKRYGMAAEFIDEMTGAAVPARQLLVTLCDSLAEDIDALNCGSLRRQLERIVERGSSAEQQLNIYRQRRDAGDSRVDALRAVVDWLIAATVPGAPAPSA
jgi:carboxylate-amine ligase